MKIVLAGIIGRYPWGGVTWCSLMYLIGLRRLGHDVYYLEDTCECNYDPELNASATDPGYALRYIKESLKPCDFGERWCYVDYLGNHHGIAKDRWKQVCASADLLIVLSGGVWIWREEYLRIPQKVFIDSDPAFTQISIAAAMNNACVDEKKRWYVDFFKNYDRLFTFGQNIGTDRCLVPTSGFTWIPTTQPVCTDLWQPLTMPSRPLWSTIMTWEIQSFVDVGGNKDQEFMKVLNLANRSRAAGVADIEIAVNGPREFLGEQGWRCVDAFSISCDLWRYHGYISNSRGEFSVAKHTYVTTNSGWFSDRTACYLAAGKPAAVQETGLSSWLPTGKGLLTWNNEDEAFECLQRVEKDYLVHATAARDLALEHFSADRVLSDLLRNCI